MRLKLVVNSKLIVLAALWLGIGSAPANADNTVTKCSILSKRAYQACGDFIRGEAGRVLSSCRRAIENVEASCAPSNCHLRLTFVQTQMSCYFDPHQLRTLLIDPQCANATDSLVEVQDSLCKKAGIKKELRARKKHKL